MRVDRFDFTLPKECIAEFPCEPRDAARMLEISPEYLHDHLHISDLPSLLKKGDVLVFNDTRVIPARVFGKRGEAKVEATLHKKIDGATWQVFAKPAKKLKIGDRFDIAPNFYAIVHSKLPTGEVLLTFNVADTALEEALEKYGVMPLPPYIARSAAAKDNDTYQTVYAAKKGAVAAPTAGLHFTESLMQKIRAKGVQTAFLTLHVGAGTFLPVKVDDTNDHKMHSEICYLSKEVAEMLNTARANGGRIIAVGTTALRTLETAADKTGTLQPFSGETDIFITPGYRFKAVDLLLTNFHLPRSTLFMLVCAFAGEKRMHEAYAHAIQHGFRFYSYGDATLLHKGKE